MASERTRSLSHIRKDLIRKVKEHPCVWDDRINKSISSVEQMQAWESIERELCSPSTLQEIQMTWEMLKEIYYRMIFIRTIERNFEAPKWKFFHDMSFLYESVKETIQNQLGGISPPLFKPRSNQKGLRCPCCVYIGPDKNSGLDMSFVEIDLNDEFETSDGATSEASLDNYYASHNSSVESICSLDDNDIQSVHRENEHENSSIPSVHRDLMKDTNCEVIELIDDIEMSPDSQNIQTLPLSDNNSMIKENQCPENTLNSSPSNNLPSTIKETIENNSMDLTEAEEANACEMPNKAELVCDKSKEKELTQLLAAVRQLRSIKRSKIIELVKANPAAYLFTYSKKKRLFTDAWNRIGEELGNVPLQALKNRWKLIKSRYLQELVLETYSNKKSTWECFQEMEFLRPHMQEDLEKICCMRDQLENTIYKSNPQSTETVLKNKNLSNEQPNKTTTSGESGTGLKESAANVNGNINVQPNKSVIIDAQTLPILQNRPIKVTAVQVLPPLDMSTITNLVHKDVEFNNNTEVPPPAKKPRKPTNCRTNKTQELESLPPPPAPCAVPCLKFDKATAFKGAEPQKILQSLNLTADDGDDLPMIETTSPRKGISPSKSVPEDNTSKVFPTLDLTADEDSQDCLDATNNLNLNQNGTGEADNNVICLDDDSISSYEEVFIYIPEESEKL